MGKFRQFQFHASRRAAASDAKGSGIFAAGAKFEPYWWEAAPRPDAGAAPLPTKTDVAIVGSGYAGLSAALTLARAGRSVAVLEANAPGEGASSRSGGMVGGGHRQGFTDLAKRHGEIWRSR